MRKLLPFVLVLLAACSTTSSGPPQIVSFTPSDYLIASGHTVVFEWELAGGKPEVQRFIYPDGESVEVIGNQYVDNPIDSGIYILEVANAAGLARDSTVVTIR